MYRSYSYHKLLLVILLFFICALDWNVLVVTDYSKQIYHQESAISLPLSHFHVTEKEIQTNLESKDWFLRKMVLFGTAISSLTEVEDLAPGFVADTLFGGLITVIREFPRFSARELMSDPSIKELQANVVNNSGIAEYLLEVFNSEKVIRGDMRLQDFIYYENYWLLMNFEAECIREYLGEEGFYGIRSIVFIGSGPLPLSSIELLPHLPDNTGTIVNYDLSEEAVRLGKALVDSQNLTHRISFVKSSVLEISELNSADVIYLAALVGESALEKRKITSHLLKIMRPGALLVARSAMGLRTFVYQRLKSQDFIGFQGFRQFDPTDKVIINSVAMVIKPLTTSVSV